MTGCEVVKKVKKSPLFRFSSKESLFPISSDDFLYWWNAQKGEIVIIASNILY